MGAATRRDLFLQVTARADMAALKAGRSVLTEFGLTANDTAAEVEKAFANLGGGSIEETARSIDAAYNKAFANIRSNLQKVADAPTPQIAVGVINAAGAEQAAAAAEAQATALRLVAEAAERAAASEQDGTSATKVYSLAQRAMATDAAALAVSLRQQATVLGNVQRELGIAADEEDELSGAHTRMGASGMIAEHVVRSFSDSLTAGQSPARAFALELPRIAEAMQYLAMESGTTTSFLGKFAGFMGGPWGLAITLGISLLAPFIGKLFETDDAAAKAMEGLKEFEAKELDLPNLIDKTTGKLKDQVAELQNLGNVAAQILPGRIQDARQDASGQAFLGFKAARDKVSAEGSTRAGPRDAQLSQAIYNSSGSLKALDASIQKMLPSRPDLAPLARVVADYLGKEMEAIAKVQDLQGQKYGLDVLARPGGSLLTADRVKREADEATATTPAQKAQLKVRAAEDNVDKIGKDAPSAAQQAMLARAEADLIAAKRTLQQVQAAANDQKGRPIDLSGAEAIVRSIGGKITSTVRTEAQQSVLYDKYQAYKAGTGPWAPVAAKPGNSQHETGHALDIAMTPGMTLEKIMAAFKAQGVNLTQHYDEGNHFHVAWGQKGPSQETLDKRQQAATTKAADTDSAYQGDLKGAQDRYAKAALALSDTAEQRYAIAIAQLQGDLVLQDKQTQDKVTAGKLTTTEALRLEIIDGMTEQLQEEAANRKKLGDLLEQQMAATQAATTAQLGILQLQLGLAPTQASKYAVAQQILEANQQQHRADVVSNFNPNSKASDSQIEAAWAEYQGLDQKEDLQKKDLAKQYADPVQAYGMKLQANVGDMGTAVKGLEADGLGSFEDGLEGIIDKSETASQAVKKMVTSIIADIAKLAVEKGLVSILGFGLKDGGKVGGYATGGLPGYASGGDPSVSNGIIRGAGTGRSDSILALVGGKKPIMISNGEGIVNERAVNEYWPAIDAMNKGTFPKFATGGLVAPNRIFNRSLPSMSSMQRAPTSSPAPITFDLRGAVMTQDLLAQMNTISAQHGQAAMIGATRQAAEDRHDDSYSAIPQ